MAGGQQCVDGGVLGAGAVGEAVSGGPWRAAVRRCPGLWLPQGRVSCGRTQAGTMPGDATLRGLAGVAPEVEPVGNLDGGGCPDAGAFCEERSTVTADDLDPRTFGQPGRDCARLAIRQQVNWSAGAQEIPEGPARPRRGPRRPSSRRHLVPPPDARSAAMTSGHGTSAGRQGAGRPSKKLAPAPRGPVRAGKTPCEPHRDRCAERPRLRGPDNGTLPAGSTGPWS